MRTTLVRGFSSVNETRAEFSLQDFVDNVPASLSKSQNYWEPPPRGFVPFAEWTERPDSLPDFVVDTGPSARALLPLDAQHSAIANYEGAATVFESRVACGAGTCVHVPKNQQTVQDAYVQT